MQWKRWPVFAEVEAKIEFKTYPPVGHDVAHALVEAVNAIGEVLSPDSIVVMTTAGYTAKIVAAQRPKAPVIAITTSPFAYHALNLVWGIKPLLIPGIVDSFEGLVAQAESTLLKRHLIESGNKILVIGGIPAGKEQGANFIKVHIVS